MLCSYQCVSDRDKFNYMVQLWSFLPKDRSFAKFHIIVNLEMESISQQAFIYWNISANYYTYYYIEDTLEIIQSNPQNISTAVDFE